MADDDETPVSNMPGVVFFLGQPHRELVRVDELGRLFMRDEATDSMVESYDMARLGRLVYRMATGGKEPPT